MKCDVAFWVLLCLLLALGTHSISQEAMKFTTDHSAKFPEDGPLEIACPGFEGETCKFRLGVTWARVKEGYECLKKLRWKLETEESTEHCTADFLPTIGEEDHLTFGKMQGNFKITSDPTSWGGKTAMEKAGITPEYEFVKTDEDGKEVEYGELQSFYHEGPLSHFSFQNTHVARCYVKDDEEKFNIDNLVQDITVYCHRCAYNLRLHSNNGCSEEFCSHTKACSLNSCNQHIPCPAGGEMVVPCSDQDHCLYIADITKCEPCFGDNTGYMSPGYMINSDLNMAFKDVVAYSQRNDVRQATKDPPKLKDEIPLSPSVGYDPENVEGKEQNSEATKTGDEEKTEL